jgi:hypothetical protein
MSTVAAFMPASASPAPRVICSAQIVCEADDHLLDSVARIRAVDGVAFTATFVCRLMVRRPLDSPSV